MSLARVLVVDDDVRYLEAVKRTLRRSQLEVTTARSGRLALQLAKQTPPDLVLLDVTMPCMSGHEFLRRFRSLFVWNPVTQQPVDYGRIPAIFVSGRCEERQVVSGLDAGAVDYITKPYAPNVLRARIRTQLRTLRNSHAG